MPGLGTAAALIARGDLAAVSCAPDGLSTGRVNRAISDLSRRRGLAAAASRMTLRCGGRRVGAGAADRDAGREAADCHGADRHVLRRPVLGRAFRRSALLSAGASY